MANNPNEVRIKVILDDEEARQRISKLQEDLEKLMKNGVGGSGGGSGSSSRGGSGSSGGGSGGGGDGGSSGGGVRSPNPSGSRIVGGGSAGQREYRVEHLVKMDDGGWKRFSDAEWKFNQMKLAGMQRSKGVDGQWSWIDPNTGARVGNPGDANDPAKAMSPGRNPEEQGRLFGKGAHDSMKGLGQAWSIAIAQKLLHSLDQVARDTIELNYLGSINYGGNNYAAERRRVEAQGNYGIVSGMTMGAMQGAAAGPYGALAGLVLGGGMGVWQKFAGIEKFDEQKRLQQQAVREDYEVGEHNRGVGVTAQMGSRAFQEILKLSGDRTKKVEMLDWQIDMLSNSGDRSIAALQGKLEKAAKGWNGEEEAEKTIKRLTGGSKEEFSDKVANGEFNWDSLSEKNRKDLSDAIRRRGKYDAANDSDPELDSSWVKETKAELSQKQGQLSQMQMQKFNYEYLLDKVNPWQSGEFSDSFSKRGLYVGAQVDMSQANKPIVDALHKIIEHLAPIAQLMHNSQVGGMNQVNRRMIPNLAANKYRPY